MNGQLDKIRAAYDRTVDQHSMGIDPHIQVPQEFKNSSEYATFKADTGSSCASSSPEIREWLEPRPGIRFLDAGCCANLANYRLDKWPSVYYGVDISPALIDAMEEFAASEHLTIGGLWVSDLSNLPFEDCFFDIAALIGVLEYYDLDYTRAAVSELNRVLKPQAKMVLDMPNPDHPQVNTMLKLEEYLGRANILKPRSSFEKLLRSYFSIEKVDDSRVMIKYFVRTSKR